MGVRAKFRLNSFTVDLHTTYPHKKENGSTDHSRPEQVEKRTLNMTPVYSDDPKDENRAFWDATPTGSLQLGVVNQEAWKHFEIGKTYYVDFTPAS